MKKFLELHRFFVKITPEYIGPLNFRDGIYYPVAYVRFMWFSYYYDWKISRLKKC